MRWESSNPAAISFPQSPHVILSLFLSLNVGPSPVMRRPYASSDQFPVVLHGQQVMLTVFLLFVFSPTLSNSPTSCVNALGVGRRKHDVVRVEEGGLVPALPPPEFRRFL